MKILVISNTAWDTNNSFGNSFSNIFDGVEDIEIANVYCRNGKPNNRLKGRYFQIYEKNIIKSIFNHKIKTGSKIEYNNEENIQKETDEAYFDLARKFRFRIFYCIRDIFWKLGRWNSEELNKFVDEFQPDIMFQPVYYSTYINQIALYFKQKYDLPMACYISDDNYTLRHISFSPIYWLERFYKRRYVKKIIKECNFLYVISEVQKKEYDQIFGKSGAVLTKCMDFTGEAPVKDKIVMPVKMVYTGNIDAGRAKTICRIAECIDKINRQELKICLDIYSKSPLRSNVLKKMNGKGISFKGGTDISMIKKIQEDADILLLAEPLDKRGAMAVHQSFSTKIVDYMWRARCIFVVGHPDCGSVSYFLKYNIGLVACSEKEIEDCLKKLTCEAEKILKDIGREVWEAGVKRHQRQEMQEALMKTLQNLAEH